MPVVFKNYEQSSPKSDWTMVNYNKVNHTANLLTMVAGIQPIYYFSQNGGNSKKFDIPVVAKVAYRFKAFEVGLSYKHGLMNTLETKYLKSGKFREYNLSLWIPF